MRSIWRGCGRGCARSFKLGYFQGGFQAFADGLCAACAQRGVQVWRQTPVKKVTQTDTGWQVIAGDHPPADYDALLVTGAPGLLARLVPHLPASYLGQLRQLRSMGAVVMTIALRQPLTNGIYWLNLPKDEFPFWRWLSTPTLLNRNITAAIA